MGSTDAIAKLLTPVEIIWALFWLASANAFFVVEDLVATANLRSANAFTYCNIEVHHHVTNLWNHQAVVFDDIPVLAFIARGVGVYPLALASKHIPELIFGAGLLNQEAATEGKAPVRITCANCWGKNTVSFSTLCVNIPEIAESASLWILFAAAVEGVVELVWSTKA